jgi:hypothetical protein
VVGAEEENFGGAPNIHNVEERDQSRAARFAPRLDGGIGPSYTFADKGSDLRTMQDYLGHRDPKHTAHYTRVAGHRFEGLWRKAE